jgi:hypothetical protein
MQSVKKWLVKMKTKPSLRNLLLARLREWKARLPRLRLPDMIQQEVELETAQDRIGWDRLVFGHVSKGWKEIQLEYYAELGKRNTG